MIPPIASRFVAGESTEAAIEHARSRNEMGLRVILNLLGEHYEDPEPARQDTETYLELIDRIDGQDLEACISIKPSQLGLDLGEEHFHDHFADVVDRASDRDVFVWIDMEDHTTTDATLEAYETFATDNEWGLGVCLQANLKRTIEDAERLADVPGKVRLVKGAYNEPESVAYQSKARVNEAYRELIEFAFEHFDRGVAIGSHDPEMIEHARECHAEYGTDFEYQMLMGVREDAQRELARDHEVWQYAPYGPRWKSYIYRRMVERKENVVFALRAILGG